jgi:hypothetical protein
MVLRHCRFNKDGADMRFVRTGAEDSWLPLHRLLAREHAHGGKVNTAPTQTHAATGQQAYTQYRSSYQFAGTVKRPSVARWCWWNFGREKGFTIDYHGTPAMGDHIFSVQIAAAEQAHQCQQVADAAIEAKQFLVSRGEAVGHKFAPSVIATVHGLGDANIQGAAMITGKLGDEATQRAVDCQRTRLVNNTPSLTAHNCHGQPATMTITGSEAEFIQLAPGAQMFQP